MVIHQECSSMIDTVLGMCWYYHCHSVGGMYTDLRQMANLFSHYFYSKCTIVIHAWRYSLTLFLLCIIILSDASVSSKGRNYSIVIMSSKHVYNIYGVTKIMKKFLLRKSNNDKVCYAALLGTLIWYIGRVHN